MTNRLATNQAQAIVWRWEGEAFGNHATIAIALACAKNATCRKAVKEGSSET